jgi:hypothetical protein
MSIYIDENENCLAYQASAATIGIRAHQSTIHWHEAHTDDSELDDMRHDDEKMLGDGSEEDDSLLVIYQDSDA